MEAIKQQVADYWSHRVEQFSKLRQKELMGEKHHLWYQEFEHYLPMEGGWKILDIGTGTGFFAFLLAALGHRVTGIDLTPEMVTEARRMAGVLEIPADFYVMDAEAPPFAGGSFDAIVTRNLTWNLPHLQRAYTQWHGLLKPGGLLLNFDADYCREDASAPLPACHAHRDIDAGLMQAYERMKEALRPTQRPRPQWDVELLEAAGFRDIRVDTEVWRRIYGEVDEFYNPTPIFAIAAIA